MSLQKAEADLRLTVLQAQVEPHFLFNTLASVRSLVTSDPQRASQTLDALAQHLRATLPKLRAATGAVQSTLGEQFAICVSYLELMQVRLGERLRVVTADNEGHSRTPLKELLTALDSETFWQVHRSVIVRVGAIHAVEKDEDGKLHLTVRGRPDALPVSSTFQYRFRGM